MQRPTSARPQIRPQTRAPGAPYRASTSSTQAGLPQLNPKFVRALVGLAAGSYVLFLARMAYAIRESRRATPAIATTVVAPNTTPNAIQDVVTGAATNAMPATDSLASRPDAPAAQAGLSKDGAPPPTSSTAGSIAGRANPGVPSITRNALPGATADSSRMLLVEPAKRAVGASLPVAATSLTPTRTDPQPFDEVQLTDGTRMIGRVDIVRAGTIIFRDMRTGLRNEINKDNIEQIITEFGTSVRFHDPTLPSNVAATAATRPVTSPSAKTRTEMATASKATGMRATGVAGRYRIRYAAATANGSPECTSVWKRPPQTEDLATVTHIPGADTLIVAFDGGDNFPSNIDKDGFFASTPRIMPDQARTSTALVTRLSGRFPPDGSLSLTVSIVFYRRMKVGADLACTVYVNAIGARAR
jgi:hypothetical protein